MNIQRFGLALVSMFHSTETFSPSIPPHPHPTILISEPAEVIEDGPPIVAARSVFRDDQGKEFAWFVDEYSGSNRYFEVKDLVHPRKPLHDGGPPNAPLPTSSEA